MATKKATYQYDNGTGWDEIMFKTTADQVVESTTKRFVSDTEKSNWNGKANGTHRHQASEIAESSSKRFVSDSEKNTWNSKANSNHNHDASYISTSSWLGSVNLEKGTKLTYNNSDCLSVNRANYAESSNNANYATNSGNANYSTSSGNSNKVGGFSPSYNSDGHSVAIRDATGKLNSHTLGRDRNGSSQWCVLEGSWVYIRSKYGGDGIIHDNEGYVRPVSNDGWSSGRDGYRWHTIWYNRYNGTSDSRLKNNIQYIGDNNIQRITFDNKSIPETPPSPDEFYNFFKDEFKACRYQYNLGRPKEEKDTCLGFLAQDLLESKVGRTILNEESTRKYEEQQEKYKDSPEILQNLIDTNRENNLRASRNEEPISLENNEPVAYLSYCPSDYITAVAIALQQSILEIEKLKNEIKELKGE